LRPVGVIRIGDRRMDALAESGIIDQGTEVEIVEIIDNQIKVRAKGPAAG
jgi:membrane-bound ClpP family serine protease